MRTWATGQAWWQGDEGPYWGHNAVVRIAPFRAHCRLPLLPDGRHILSHDQVEAAVLRGAGWGVRVLPDEDGSGEANPPALPEFLRRELRWLAGNLQYRHLLRLPGLRPMGRWQLVQAILLFAGTPLYLLFLLAAAAAAATDATSPFPAGAGAGADCRLARRALRAEAAGLCRGGAVAGQAARYGGLARFAAGAAAEFGFTLLLDAVSAVARPAPCCGWRSAGAPAGRRRTAAIAAWPGARRRGCSGRRPLLGVAGVRRLRRRRLDGDAVGTAACRRAAGGDPALRPHRRSARSAAGCATGRSRRFPRSQPATGRASPAVAGLALQPQPEPD